MTEKDSQSTTSIPVLERILSAQCPYEKPSGKALERSNPLEVSKATFLAASDNPRDEKMLEVMWEVYSKTEKDLSSLYEFAPSDATQEILDSTLEKHKLFHWFRGLSHRFLYMSPTEELVDGLLTLVYKAYRYQPSEIALKKRLNRLLMDPFLCQVWYYSAPLMKGLLRVDAEAFENERTGLFYHYDDVQLAWACWNRLLAKAGAIFEHHQIFQNNHTGQQYLDMYTRMLNQTTMMREKMLREWDTFNNSDFSIEQISYGEVLPTRINERRLADIPLDSAQEFLAFVLHHIRAHRLRRVKGDIYAPISVEYAQEENGVPAGIHYTHAWSRQGSIEELVWRLASPDVNQVQYRNFTAKGNGPNLAKRLATQLEKSSYEDFPELVMKTNVFSFRNGVYDAENNKFYTYGGITIPSVLIASKYFDTFMPMDYIRCPDWHDIPTPTIDHILRCQQIEGEVYDWWIILEGRLLYPVGKDDWQAIKVVKGVPGSGKSTNARIWYLIKPRERIGLIGTNLQQEFGTSSIYDKDLVLCLEMRTDKLGISTADLQSAASGEEVLITPKGSTSFSFEWKAGFVFYGNQHMPGNAALGRRGVFFEFNFPVHEAIAFLTDRLKAEIPAIIAKFNRAYLEALEKYGTKTLYSPGVLPKYFFNTRRNMRAESNSLLKYFVSAEFSRDYKLPSETVRRCADECDMDGHVLADFRVISQQFESDYQEWMRQFGKGGKQVSLVSDEAREIFDEFGIAKHVDTSSGKPSTFYTGLMARKKAD